MMQVCVFFSHRTIAYLWSLWRYTPYRCNLLIKKTSFAFVKRHFKNDENMEGTKIRSRLQAILEGKSDEDM